MKKALIIRGFGAVGDMIFISQAPRLLKEKHEYDQVDIVVSERNASVFYNNPYVDNLLPYSDFKENNYEDQMQAWRQKYQVFDFTYSVEKRFLQKTIWPDIGTIEDRRQVADGKNYYDCSLKYAGLESSKHKGELYLSDEEQELVTLFEQKPYKKIIWNVVGSTKNKVLLYAPSLIKSLLNRHKNVHHFLVNLGQMNDPAFVEDERIHDLGGKTDSRMAMILTKAADVVVGPESLLINAAGCFDTPVVCFLSHSTYANLLSGFEHAKAIIPQCDCSPCYLIPSDFRGYLNTDERHRARRQEYACTQFNSKYIFEADGFKCCTQINKADVIHAIEELLCI